MYQSNNSTQHADFTHFVTNQNIKFIRRDLEQLLEKEHMKFVTNSKTTVASWLYNPATFHFMLEKFCSDYIVLRQQANREQTNRYTLQNARSNLYQVPQNA